MEIGVDVKTNDGSVTLFLVAPMKSRVEVMEQGRFTVDLRSTDIGVTPSIPDVEQAAIEGDEFSSSEGAIRRFRRRYTKYGTNAAVWSFGAGMRGHSQ